MNEEQLRQWLRENLRVDVRLASGHSCENSVYVSLRFANESNPFSEERIYIPEDQ